MGRKETLSPSIKKALVTGGGGFVGKAIVKRLVKLGVKTTVLGRHRYPEIEQLGVECIVGNVSDQVQMNKA
ncbi:MAG: NAD-dependent epimerase/dehydratase family protein, partial [Desulfobulbaceae bacterium]|nr:NAD-dependent epimerase/dehydratase family protein [Desulfobulbaceae bacterium]